MTEGGEQGGHPKDVLETGIVRTEALSNWLTVEKSRETPEVPLRCQHQDARVHSYTL